MLQALQTPQPCKNTGPNGGVSTKRTLSDGPIVAWFDRFESSRFERRHSLVADKRVVRISPIGQVSLRFGTFLRWNGMQ